MPEIQLLNLAGVCRITNLSKSSILRLRNAGDFPQPVQVLSKNMFVKQEVIDWALARVAARAAPGDMQRIVRVSADGTTAHSSR